MQQKKIFFPLWFNLHFFLNVSTFRSKAPFSASGVEIKLFEVMKTTLLLISCLFFASTVRAAKFNDEGKYFFLFLYLDKLNGLILWFIKKIVESEVLILS